MKPQYEPKTDEQKLGYLVEECGEVLAAAGKAIRWGLDSVNPELPEAERETNRDWLARELTDLSGAIVRVREVLSAPATPETPPGLDPHVYPAMPRVRPWYLRVRAVPRLHARPLSLLVSR